MTTCPKGHASAATDYCDECGTPINAAPTPPPSTPEPGASNSDNGTTGAAGGPCPECATPRTDRFCEVCGHDFLAEPAAVAAPSQPESTQPESTQPESAESASDQPVSTQATSPTTTAEWRVTVIADRAYHERMRIAAGPDAPAVVFPAYCPQRRFELSGAEVLIGRTSRSRGIAPGIDLTGPPEDVAVSHMHALLVAGPDGGWSIVDLDSANGTYLNGDTEQLVAHQPVVLSPGDQVHIGGWTTLTLTRV